MGFYILTQIDFAGLLKCLHVCLSISERTKRRRKITSIQFFFGNKMFRKIPKRLKTKLVN